MVRTRGRDHGLAAAGGHLRGTRCDPPGGGTARGEPLGREDLGGEQHAAEGGDGQASPDHGGGHAGEGLVERLTLRIRGRSIMATATKTRLKVFPLADRVEIRPLEDTEERKGGLYIPDTAKEKPIQGEVIAVWPGRLEKGQRVPMELKVGDRVVYGKYTGSQVELEDEEIILIKESDVIAKLS